MSRPINPNPEQWNRLTPDASQLNRDELMFAAGQASVRRSYFWPVVASLLAIGQTLTLVLLFNGTPSVPISGPPAMEIQPTAEPSLNSPQWEGSSLIAQRRMLLSDPETGYRPLTSPAIDTESWSIMSRRSALNLD